MSLIRTCDKCDERIDLEGPLNDRSWVQVAVGLDELAKDGHIKDYHRECARTITIAEAWARKWLVPL